jgi:hypothetical protein
MFMVARASVERLSPESMLIELTLELLDGEEKVDEVDNPGDEGAVDVSEPGPARISLMFRMSRMGSASGATSETPATAPK